MLLLRAILLLTVLTIAAASAWRIQAPRGRFFSQLLGLLLLAWSVEFIGMVTSQLSVRNIILYNLYTSVEFVVLFHLVEQIRPAWRHVLRIGQFTGMLAMSYSMWLHGPNRYLAIEGLLTIGLLSCSTFLMVLIDLARESEVRLSRRPTFWLFSGALIYFGGTIPILGVWKFIGNLDQELSQVLYWIVVVLAMVRYTCVSVACRLARQRVEPIV